MSAAYMEFLRSKIATAPRSGFDVADADIHPRLFPHQRDAVRWALAGGRRALFASFGLGKTTMQLEIARQVTRRVPGQFLIILPLGVRMEFAREAAALGMGIRYVTSDAEAAEGGQVLMTNYERVRDGAITPDYLAGLAGVSLDEASVLRSFGSKTYQTFLGLFADVPLRFVATATPSPNRFKELIHYGGFLGVMDTGQALTRFFQRDSEKAGNLTLMPHMAKEFWLWLSTWALFITSPADLCRCSCHGNGSHSRAAGSADSLSSDGIASAIAKAGGSADATAAALATPHPATCSTGELRAADASTPATATKEPVSTASGAGCGTAAAGRTIKTGATTAGAASPSASDGKTSATSSQTWESRAKGQHSTGSTTTATTNQATVDGPTGRSKPTTAGVGPNTPSGHATSTGGSPRNHGSCDTCRCTDGYDLPPLTVHWHKVDVRHQDAGSDSWGQALLFRDAAAGVRDAAREKRDTLPARLAKARELIAAEPGEHWLLWHHLEAERHAIEAAWKESGEAHRIATVYGTQDLDEREDLIRAFADGELPILATKPEIAGSGTNLQRHCARAIFLGIDYSFNDLIQSIHRVYRFQQSRPVEIHIIYADSEAAILRAMKRKWAQHEEMTAKMREIVQTYGLADAARRTDLERTIGVDRREWKGERFTAVLNDCVLELAGMPSDSVDMVCTSIPFGNQYEYTPSYNDFGFSEDNAQFFAQYRHLLADLLRVLKPGRVAAIHVKDRIRFARVTGLAAPTVDRFSDQTAAVMEEAGFVFFGRITIVTDVVRENNQTYRLGWSEMCKDGTKMGVGMPEYVLLFRKLPSDCSNGYADEPVVHEKEAYTRAQWQVDAHGFWRSSGDRMLRPDEIAEMEMENAKRWYEAYSRAHVYNYAAHVELGRELEAQGRLPATFMLLAPSSWTDEVWTDITRMRSLNSEQSRKALANHVCPFPLDIPARLIERFTNPGELVLDPFGGLGTTAYMAIKAGRRGYLCELNAEYWWQSVGYCQAAESEATAPTLFDALDAA